MERNHRIEERIDAAEGNTGSLRTSDEGRNNRQAHRPSVYALTAAEGLVQERQEYDRDNLRINEHQNGNSRNDDGLQTEHSDAEGPNGENRYPAFGTKRLKYLAQDEIRPIAVDKQASNTMIARMIAPTSPKRIIALLESTGAPVS